MFVIFVATCGFITCGIKFIHLGQENDDHCCLGNLAFNIGLALSRGHMYLEACPLLDVACKELSQWCEGRDQCIQKVRIVVTILGY